MQPAIDRVGDCLATLVRHARLPGADELEEAIGLRVDAAGAVILERLDPNAGTRLRDLADRLGLAPSTISRQLPPLETAGYVTRHPDPDDGRASLLHLTPSGVEARDRVAAYRTAWVSDLVAHWPDQDIAQLADLLERFVHALARQHAR